MRFESERDRAEQFRVASLIECAWNARVERTGDLSTFDYRVMRGDQHAVSIEIKRRYVPYTKYPTILLSSRKAELLRAMRPQALLVVAWNDHVGWYPASSFAIDRVRIGGRPPRAGAVHDIEGVIDIDRDAFRSLSVWPSF